MPADRSPSTALTDSGRLALAVLADLPDTSVVVFDHDLRIALASGLALAQHAWTAELIAGRLLAEMLPAEAFRQLRSRYEAALAGETHDFRYETVDGTRWYQVQTRPVHDSEGEIVGGAAISRDITPLHLAEEALRRNRAHLQSILESLWAPVFVKDRDCRIVTVNSAYAALLGKPPDDLIGKSVRDLFAPRYAEVYDRDDRHVLETGETVHGERVVPDANGDERVHNMVRAPLRDGDGRIYGVVGLAMDITDAKRSERELFEAHDRFEQVFEHAPIGTALVQLDGRVVRVNDALCRIADLPRERVLALTLQDFAAPEDLDKELVLVDRLIRGEIGNYELEATVPHLDGRTLRLFKSVALVHDKQGAPLYFIAQIQDVTKRSELEHELRRRADEDPVTCLSSRARFEHDLDQQFARCRRYDERAALLLIDLDGLKPLNDHHGHAAGDAALRHVGEVLRDRTRQSDVVARLGGDEFVILAPHLDAQQARTLLDDISAKLAASPLDLGDGRTVTLSLSIGVAEMNSQTPSVEQVIGAADSDMYRAKRGY
jgi:diguanylate cyclase (GGDEF)-like protein/PAS domain S-box-containing protein